MSLRETQSSRPCSRSITTARCPSCRRATGEEDEEDTATPPEDVPPAGDEGEEDEGHPRCLPTLWLGLRRG